jgi:hypothetical protein
VCGVFLNLLLTLESSYKYDYCCSHPGTQHNCEVTMPLLALLAPFGAIILSLLLAVALCYAAAYASLWQCFRRSGPRSAAGSEALKKVVVDVSVLGLQIEGEKGVAGRSQLLQQYQLHQGLLDTSLIRDASAQMTHPSPTQTLITHSCPHWVHFSPPTPIHWARCHPHHQGPTAHTPAGSAATHPVVWLPPQQHILRILKP